MCIYVCFIFLQASQPKCGSRARPVTQSPRSEWRGEGGGGGGGEWGGYERVGARREGEVREGRAGRGWVGGEVRRAGRGLRKNGNYFF